jgi:hypothetical protein
LLESRFSSVMMICSLLLLTLPFLGMTEIV